MKFTLCTTTLLFCLLLPFIGESAAADTPKQNLEPVTIQLRWFHQFQFAGYYAAVEMGFYAESGLDVTLRQIDRDNGRITPVLEGEAEYGVGDAGLLKLRAEGRPVVVLAQIFQHSPLVLITRKESGIFNPHDLVGKKVMFNPGEATYLLAMFNTMLEGVGQIEAVPHSHSIEELVSGEVDAISAYLTNEPYRLKRRGVDVNIINPRDYGFNFYGDNLFTTDDEIRNHPERVEKMRRATLRGWEYALNNKGEIIDLILEKYNPGLDRELLEIEARVTESMIQPDLTPLGEVSPRRYDRMAEIFAQLRMIDGSQVPPGLLYDQRGEPLIELTAQERAWLARHPEITIAFDGDFPPYSVRNQAGDFEGIAVDFAREVARRAGIRLKVYPSGDWEKLYAAARRRDVDVVATLVKRPEREERFAFTHPYISLSQYIITRKGNDRIRRREDIAAERVALVEGYSTTRYLLEEFPSVEPVYVETVSEALQAVSAGHAEATVAAISMAHHLIAKQALPNLKFAAPYAKGLSEQRFGVRNDWPELAAILGRALSSISEEEKLRIFRRWTLPEMVREEMAKPVSQLVLTDEERAWLRANPVIRVAAHRKWAPIEFTDAQGAFRGVSVDYLTRLSDLIGVDFRIAEDLDWRQAIQRVRDRDLDMFSAVVAPLQRQESVSLTSPHFSTQADIFTRSDESYVTELKELEGRRVAVFEGHAFGESLKRDHPEIEVVEFPDIEEALKRLRRGDVFAYVGSRLNASYYLRELGYQEQIRVSGETDYRLEISMGVRSDWPLFADILQKGLYAIEADERRTINRRWIVAAYEKRSDYSLAWKVLAGILFMLAAVLFWNRRLSGEIGMRKRAEEELHWHKKKLEALVDQRTSEVDELAKARRASLNIMEDLKDARIKAEEATRSKSDFLARMSHEIRTPMNAIIGMGELALQTELTPQQRDYLDKSQFSCRTLLGILNDILDFSKIEAGKLEIESAAFDLEDVLEHLFAMVSMRAEGKGLEILFDMAPDVPMKLVGDSLRLGQVLLNLTSNAVKFTEAGEVAIRVEVVGEQDGEVTLRFSVRDTGVGLTRKQQERIFQAFEQTEVSVTREHGGTGLGLAVSKRLVKLMGGAISLESEPGAGSTFSFAATFGRPSEGKKGPYMPPPDVRGKQILVMDDNDTGRGILRGLLEGFSFAVSTAASAQEALTELDKAPPERPVDLVIMDWEMPGMEGIEAARRIKSHPLLAKCPLIVMASLSGRQEVLEQAGRIELQGSLLKPVLWPMLLRTILAAFQDKPLFFPMVRPLEKRGNGAQLAKPIRGARVLVVEDNELNQQIARELLKNAGLDVTMADNGKEALQTVQTREFDAVLMDIQMPEMGGIEATRRIRALGEERFKKLPIIAMTAHAMAGDRDKSLAAGMNDHVTKPLDLSVLLTSLLRWIEPGRRAVPERAPDAPPPIEESELPEQIPGIDMVNGVRRVGGNRKLYRKLLQEYRRDNEAFAGDLRQALSGGNRETARRMAHTLKGVSGNLGVNGVQKRAEALNDGLARDEADVEELVGALERELRPVLRAISERLPADARHPVAEQTAAQKEAVDVDSLRPRLKELARLLEVNDMAAERVFTQIEPMLRAIQPRRAGILAERLDALDFKGAANALARITDGLSGDAK